MIYKNFIKFNDKNFYFLLFKQNKYKYNNLLKQDKIGNNKAAKVQNKKKYLYFKIFITDI